MLSSHLVADHGTGWAALNVELDRVLGMVDGPIRLRRTLSHPRCRSKRCSTNAGRQIFEHRGDETRVSVLDSSAQFGVEEKS